MTARAVVTVALAGTGVVAAAAIAAAAVQPGPSPASPAALARPAAASSSSAAPASEVGAGFEQERPGSTTPQAQRPTPTSTPTTLPGVPPVLLRPVWGRLAPAKAAAEVLAATSTYLEAADAAYSTVSIDPVKDERLAIGPALGEVRAAVSELSAAGVHQEGRVTVAKASVFTVKQPERLLAVVCLDASAVTLIQTGDDGVKATLRPAQRDKTRLDLHVYLLQQVRGRWVVLKHDLPGNTACDR